MAGLLEEVTDVAAQNDAADVVRGFFVNRCPLLARFPWEPVTTPRFMTALQSEPSDPLEKLANYLLASYLNGRGDKDGKAALTKVAASRDQYCQRFFCPVVRDSSRPGTANKFSGFHLAIQLQNLVDNFERCAYYGIGSREMVGLRSILQTNNLSSHTGRTPDSAAGYRLTDFMRDTLWSVANKGGKVDTLIVSPSFMVAFAKWGLRVQAVPSEKTIFGVQTETWNAPGFLRDVSIIVDPCLNLSTAVALTGSEVFIRNKRNPSYRRHEDDSNIIEGDWYAELAIDVVNEHHHAWVEGITGFSED